MSKEKNEKPLLPKTPKSDDQKSKFSFYWVYGLLAVIFIGLQFYSWDTGTKRIEKGELLKMLQEQDVDSIILVNKESAEIFVKAERLSKYKGEDGKPKSKKVTFGVSQPDFLYQIGEVGTF